jgi:OFA family oxalate/formate antiporter-like MFS transporter
MSLGVGATVLICLFTRILTNPPTGYVPTAAGTPGASPRKPAAARRDLDWHEMLRSRQFYLLWLMFVLTASAGLMIIAHVAIIAKEQARWEWGVRAGRHAGDL